MSDLWYYFGPTGRKLGPVASYRLSQLVESGRLHPEDRVLWAGSDEYEPDTPLAKLLDLPPGYGDGPRRERTADGGDLPMLVACEGCGVGISDMAESCPKCGRPQSAVKGGGRGGRCAWCGTFNALDWDADCRGCGLPLKEANGEEFLVSRAQAAIRAAPNTAEAFAYPGAVLVLLALGAFGEWGYGVVAGLAAFGLLTVGVRRWSCLRYMRHYTPRPAAVDWGEAERRCEAEDPGIARRRKYRGYAAMAAGALLVVGLAYDKYQSGHASGRQAGAQFARDAAAGGVTFERAAEAAAAFEVAPQARERPWGWNAGFREGFEEVAARSFSGTRRRR